MPLERGSVPEQTRARPEWAHELHGNFEQIPFSTLTGRWIADAWYTPSKDEFWLLDWQGFVYRMAHEQDCCENVVIEDITGDISDLFGYIALAEEISNAEQNVPTFDDEEYPPDSFTWTYYKLATVLGRVTIRWLGTSNGYYSEHVQFGVRRQEA